MQGGRFRFRVQGSWLRIQGSDFGDQVSRFRDESFGVSLQLKLINATPGVQRERIFIERMTSDRKLNAC